MPNLETEVIHTGFHSIIRQGTLTSGDIYLSKHYGEKAERGFEIPLALDMITLMKRFVDIAEELEIPIAKPHGYYISDNHFPGLANVVEVVPHKGNNLLERCRNPQISDTEIRGDLRQYLALFKTVWSRGFPISLDPPPANFSVDTNGKAWYIDCMPPRQICAGGTVLSEWPAPPPEYRQFIEERYFSELQARVIYAQILRATSGRHITPQELKTDIESILGPYAFDLINISNDVQTKILASPQQTDADAIRIITGEQFEMGNINEPTLKEIYHLTHIKNGGVLPPLPDIQQATQILSQNIYA
jgi:hypothetical protein